MGLTLSRAEIRSRERDAAATYARLAALMAAFVERHCELDPVAFAPRPLLIAAWERFVDTSGLAREYAEYEANGLHYYNNCRHIKFPSPPYAHPSSPGHLLGIRLVSMPGV